MPQYVQFREGANQVLFHERDGVSETNHWVNGKAHLCAAPNCTWCQSGIESRQRYVITATVNGVQGTLTLAPMLYDTIKGLLGDDLAGKRGIVTRQGTGLQTRYSFVASPSEAPAVTGQGLGDPQIPSASGGMSVIDRAGVVKLLRDLALSIEQGGMGS